MSKHFFIFALLAKNQNSCEILVTCMYVCRESIYMHIPPMARNILEYFLCMIEDYILCQINEYIIYEVLALVFGLRDGIGI